MIASTLMGALAGARSMTPLAAVSIAAWQGALPKDNGAPAILAHPLVVAGTTALAAGELVGDKMPSAPDRIVVAGLLARLVTGAIVGMAVAPRRHQAAAAVAGASAAVASAFPTFAARMKTMESHGQTSTGLVEDAMIVAGTACVMRWLATRD